MTITYTGKVADARLGSFSRLLFYWRGSIYKLMYKEMVIFCVFYTAISLIYRFALNVHQKRVFEQISLYCRTFTDLIPMAFILGFYVSIVVTRWWNQYLKIPWPDRVMMYLVACLEGIDEYTRLVRRTIVRYLTLGSLLVFQNTAEAKDLHDIECPHGKWWIPFLWIVELLKEARRDGRVSDSFSYKSLLDEVMVYRGSLGELYSYDWISVPLVYTQVTTLAVYMFFLGALFGQQFLDPSQGYSGHSADLYVPLFTLMQFFFYMGWLKVAEQLINPFGEDDDDFEMNWIIDRNLQISLLAVDDLYGHHPVVEKDMYYGEPPPEFLPYTKSSIATKIQPHMGSMANLAVSSEGMRTVNPMDTIQEDVMSHSVPIPRSPSRFDSHSRFPSPCGSPWKSRHLHPNLQIPASVSKLTIDDTFAGRPGTHSAQGATFGSHNGRGINSGTHIGPGANFGSHNGPGANFEGHNEPSAHFDGHGGHKTTYLKSQPFGNSLGSKTRSYMEWWLHKESQQDVASLKADGDGSNLRSTPLGPKPDSLIFNMEEPSGVIGKEGDREDSAHDNDVDHGTLLRTMSLTREAKAAKVSTEPPGTQPIARNLSRAPRKPSDGFGRFVGDQNTRSRHTSSSDDSSVDYNYMRPNQRGAELMTPLLRP